MKILLCIVLVLCYFTSGVDANEKKGVEYIITAKKLNYVPEKQRIFLRDSVKIVNELFTITAKNVDVVLLDGNTTSALFSNDIKEILFYENVNFTYKQKPTSKPITGSSDTARYDIINEVLYMSGNVFVNSDGNIVEGTKASVNLVTNDVEVFGSAKTPVEVLLKQSTKE